MVSKINQGDATRISGVSGLPIWSGVLGEEYLTVFKGSRKAKIFREMQDDVVIGTLLDSLLMPLLAAEFSVVPAGDTEKDKQNAQFLNECLDDMTRYTWRQHVIDQMSMIVWGWSVSEIVAKKRSGGGVYPPSKYDDGKIGLHILDPRGQETLKRWEMDEEFNVEKMVQQDPLSGKSLEIDAWKMLHVTFRSRKRSPEGSSPLRSLYRAWYTRKNLEIIEAIGSERDLCGLPVIHLPYGAGDDDKTAAETLIRNIRQDEEAGLVIPPPPSPEGDGGWKFELIGSPGQKQFNVREIIRDLNKIILMRFFAQFLLLGMEQVGTQALVKGSHDFFALCLKSIQQELLETWNSQLVPFLFNMNPQMITGSSGVPRISWGSTGVKDVQQAANIMEKMVKSQILTPEETLEDYLRGVLGLPDRPDGVGEGERSPAPSPTLMSFDWQDIGDGSWLLRPKKSQAYAQPDSGDVHIPTAGRKRKRRDHCMECAKPPSIEVMWAEGRARAWFCAECYKSWKQLSMTHEAVAEREVTGGVVPEKWFAEGAQEYVEAANYGEVAGIKGRRATSKIGSATNEYQGLLTHIYDQWAKRAHRAILTAGEGSRTSLVREIDKQMLSLSKSLIVVAGKHIEEAFRLGFNGTPDSEALKLLNKQVKTNEKFMKESLIPRLRMKIVSHLEELEARHQYQLDDVSLMGLLQSMRSEPAGYAGAFWNSIFVANGLVRKREDKQRINDKQKPKRVRWVLDPTVEHCKSSLHGHGCPDLARIYESWDAMPTVPAGDVTCLGNCRCHVEVESNTGGWDRVA